MCQLVLELLHSTQRALRARIIALFTIDIKLGLTIHRLLPAPLLLQIDCDSEQPLPMNEQLKGKHKVQEKRSSDEKVRATTVFLEQPITTRNGARSRERWLQLANSTNCPTNCACGSPFPGEEDMNGHFLMSEYSIHICPI